MSSLVVFIGRLTSTACLRLGRAQRRTRDASLVAAGCPGRRGPLSLAGPALRGRSSVTGVAPCRIPRGGLLLVGLAARLGARTCRGRGGMLRVGSPAASAT